MAQEREMGEIRPEGEHLLDGSRSGGEDSQVDRRSEREAVPLMSVDEAEIIRAQMKALSLMQQVF